MPDIEKGITITFRGNTASFDNSIGDIEKALKVIQADTKQLNKELKLDPTNVDKLNDKLKNLQATLELQRKELSQYRKKIMEAVEPSKELANSEEYKKVNAQLEMASKNVSDLRKQLVEAKNAGNDVKDPEGWAKLNAQYDQAQAELERVDNELYDIVSKDYNVLDWKQYTDSMRQYHQIAGDIAKTQASIVSTQDKIDHKKLYDTANAFGEFGKKAKTVGQAITKVGQAFKWVSGIAAGALTGAVKAAQDWETAWVKVEKVVNETDTTKYEDIQRQIKEMAMTIPVDIETITEAFANAGQLGVNTDNLEEFVETMLRLDSATNISAEEAAMTIAQLFNVIGAEIGTVDDFANALVRLGNNSATTEKDILEMASTIGASAHQVGFTTDQILGLADALAGAGLNPSSAGTAISNILTKLDKLAAKTTDDLYKYDKKNRKWVLSTTGQTVQAYAKILGLRGTLNQQLVQFKKMLDENAAETFALLIEKMKEASDKGENINVLFEKIGISGIKQDSTLKALINSYPLLTDALNMASDAFANGTDAVDESNKAWGTFTSKVTTLWNNLKVLGQEIGEIILPVLGKIVDKITEWVQAFIAMDEEDKKRIVNILAILAALAPILIVVGKILIFVGEMAILFKQLIQLFPLLSSLAPFGVWALVIAGIITAIILFKDKIVELWNAFLDSEFWQTIKTRFQELSDFLGAIWDLVQWIVNGIGSLFKSLGDKIKEAWQSFKSLFQVYNDMPPMPSNGSSRSSGGGSGLGLPQLKDAYSGGMGVPTLMMAGGTSLSLQTTIQVTNNGTPIDEQEIRRWGNVITDMVSDNLGKRW